jgi:adenosylcobinamide-GDP ribazoletransferase
MDRLFSAIRFLTIFPIGRHETFDAREMIPFFPVVGLILGALLAIFDRFASAVWSTPVASLLDVVVLIVLTAALHVDGLADTADGLYGGKSKETALAIMKDSRVGAMGLIAVVCVVLMKCAGVAGLEDNRGIFLVVIPAYSRCAMMFGFYALPYGRPDGGLGHAFFERPLGRKDFWGLGLIVGISVLTGWRSLVLIIGFLATTYVLVRFYSKRMGCITGDMLGAMVEITEAALFLAASALTPQ